MRRADMDSRGRPVVVVTGTGVVTSLGRGKRGQLARTDCRALGNTAHLAISDRRPAHEHRRHGGLRTGRRTVCAGTFRAHGGTGCRRGAGGIRHRHAGRLSWSDVSGVAASRVGMAAAPRPGRRFRRQRSRQLRRSAARCGNGKVRALLRAVPVRLGRGKPCGALRYQGLAGGNLNRLRIGCHRHSTRCRGDSGAARPRRLWWSGPMHR